MLISEMHESTCIAHSNACPEAGGGRVRVRVRVRVRTNTKVFSGWFTNEQRWRGVVG